MEVSTTFEQPITGTSSPSPEPYQMNGLIPVIVIGIFGVVGNGLVLFVLLWDKKSRGNQRNILILNQSLIDLLTSIDFIITFVSRGIPKSYKGTGVWWCWLIDAELPMWSIISISTVNLMVITAERYMMVVHPAFYQNHVTKKVMYGSVVSVWISVTFINVVTTYPFARELEDVCQFDVLITNVWFDNMYIVCYYIAPIVMFSTCYPRMIFVMKRRLRVSPAEGQNHQGISKKQINLTNVMLSVSIVFIICWSPSLIILLLTYCGVENIYHIVYLYLTHLIFINSCINPFLYAFQYNDFKRGIRQLLKNSEVGILQLNNP